MATGRAKPPARKPAAPRSTRPAPAARPARGRSGATPATTGMAALVAAFDRGDFPPSLYLEGPSEPLKAAILRDLREAWAGHVPAAPAARVLRVAEAGVEGILASYQTGSLFAPRELTVVLEIEDLARSEKRVAALAEGLGGPAGESCLVLVESESDSPRKTLAPIRGACAVRVVAEAPGRAELIGWGGRRLRHEKITAEAGVLEHLADACENDALAYFSELGRLTTFAGAGGKVSLRDAETLLTPAVGAVLTDYLGAVCAGDAGRASRRLGRLLAAGENEGSILWALTNLVGGALGGWSRQRELSATLRARRTPAQLMRVMDALYRAEAAWKSGRADALAVLEQATRVAAGA